ncbi:MAG: general secretion pathway protein GspK [Myxococcales bacterium]|nr:general secretion pathway protein GspK [Myxococcales bacterium]
MTRDPHTPAAAGPKSPPRRLPARRRRPRLRSERGVALLMVLVTVAVLTAVVYDFVHQTRVEVRMAENNRDRLQAYYLARSAVNFGRLILHFQGQVDRFTGGMVKLYQLIPVESDLARALTSGEVGEALGLSGLNLGTGSGFGEFAGRFSATIEDEYAKININALDSIPSIAAPVAAHLLTLIGNARYRTLFELPDADGQYSSPAEVVNAIRDWIDANNSQDALNPDALLRDPFSQALVFVPGASGEDSRYDMLKDPYRNKNDPMISVDELYFIRGIGDDFMNEFGDKFTVYSDPSLLVSLNSVNDPVMLLSLLCLQPENQPLCTEQGLPKLLEVIALFFEFRNLMQFSTFMVPDAKTIQEFFASQGPSFNAYFMKNLAPFSDTFTIQATGAVNDTSLSIRAVVKNTAAGQEILYWREM